VDDRWSQQDNMCPLWVGTDILGTTAPILSRALLSNSPPGAGCDLKTPVRQRVQHIDRLGEARKFHVGEKFDVGTLYSAAVLKNRIPVENSTHARR